MWTPLRGGAGGPVYALSTNARDDYFLFLAAGICLGLLALGALGLLLSRACSSRACASPQAQLSCLPPRLRACCCCCGGRSKPVKRTNRSGAPLLATQLQQGVRCLVAVLLLVTVAGALVVLAAALLG